MAVVDLLCKNDMYISPEHNVPVTAQHTLPLMAHITINYIFLLLTEL